MFSQYQPILAKALSDFFDKVKAGELLLGTEKPLVVSESICLQQCLRRGTQLYQ